MAIRKYKPTTPGRRGSSVADFAAMNASSAAVLKTMSSETSTS